MKLVFERLKEKFADTSGPGQTNGSLPWREMEFILSSNLEILRFFIYGTPVGLELKCKDALASL